MRMLYAVLQCVYVDKHLLPLSVSIGASSPPAHRLHLHMSMLVLQDLLIRAMN